MNIKEYEIADSEWNEVVKSFNNYSVFDLHEYVQAQSKIGSGHPKLVLFEEGDQRAMVVLMIRDIAESNQFKGLISTNEFYDISTVYGYGGMISNNDFYPVKEYLQYCKDFKYVSEFVRFNLFSGYREKYLGKVETRSHNIVKDTSQPLDIIVQDYDRKVRKNIKTAINAGMSIKMDDGAENLEDFLRIYNSTMERNDAASSFYFSKDYFLDLCKMKENSLFFYAIIDEKIISTELVLYDKDIAYSFLGGTDEDYYQYRPNDYLKSEIIKWANNKRISKFVLGGGYGKDDGIFQYKKFFSPNGAIDFYIGEMIFDLKTYEELIKFRISTDSNFDLNSNFFPLYRA